MGLSGLLLGSSVLLMGPSGHLFELLLGPSGLLVDSYWVLVDTYWVLLES